jgi:hypothetical protein
MANRRRLSRRELLRRAGAAGVLTGSAGALAPAFAGTTDDMLLLLFGGPSAANAAAYFPIQASAASNIINGVSKDSQFPNVPFNQSVASSIVATILPEDLSDIPAEGMRLFTQHRPGDAFEFLTVDIWPPGTMLTTANGVTSWGVPMLRVKAATALGVATFIGMLPRWYPGTWETLVILLNDITRGLQAGVSAYQFLKGQREPSLEQLAMQAGYPNRDRPTSAIINVPMNIPVGMTGFGPQLDITIGRIPNTGGPGAQGSLVNTTIGSVTYSPVAADPAYTLNQVVDLNSGTFKKPGFGSQNLFTSGSGYSPVALIGDVQGDGLGFMRNFGSLTYVDPSSDSLFVLDTRFGNSGPNLVDPAQGGQDPFGP